MSFSANHKIKNKSWNYLDTKYFDTKIDKYFKNKRDTSKKEESRLNISKFNNTYIPTTLSNSSIATNISIVKDKNKENDRNIVKAANNEIDFSNNSFQCPIKTIKEDSFENVFMSKQKIIYKSPKKINNKIISFQKQRNKKILEFSIFNDRLVFKDINESYLQDEQNDDGSESSDEKINDGKLFMTQEIESSSKIFKESFDKNKVKKFLSRRPRLES